MWQLYLGVYLSAVGSAAPEQPSGHTWEPSIVVLER